MAAPTGSRASVPPSARVGPRVRYPSPRRSGPLRAVGAAGLSVALVALGLGGLVLVRGADPVDGEQTSAAGAGAEPAAPLPAAPPPPAPVVEPPPPAAPVVAPPPPARPTVTVLNNSRIPRLAAGEAARYQAAGWPVGLVGSLRGRIRATTVYYPPGQREQAQELATAFGVPRVLPRLATLPGSGITVVVTRDLAG